MPSNPLPALPDAPSGWEDVVGSIGPKVRVLRLERGMTLQQLARAAEVSTASVHKVERGDMVPTITTLLKIAGALGAPIRHFVEDDDTAPTAVLTRFADGIAVGPVTITGSPDRFRARGTVARLEPGEQRPGLRRAGETLLIVLEGRLDVEVAADRYEVAAGEALHFPSGLEHRCGNSSGAPVEVVAVDVPES
ncbi:cupin domain-containing protein [Pseudonocardia sp. KRD-184]|uniref:Cupin domain-containing protein n=1 Tax=Pseudonocardia oceani TaxID=2792013 RepID=A0ABS6U910_9PSEU|nr:XRE family transcriptional regulator [Pseudonocardia oceani]MBW0089450.1 cupin domain-containing protein [Pseudonocardia oceani]MBW0096456.1 cupin domain-containing protein [Pseudonocardia oceani]MBW0109150.1 cupin domain-containing protein [Pseudonocardia oceani]MBW0120697.1 cupin domain-containing protein [Pseudonocardia oceani]MBW0128369.1 cupin domain-containing protein [Pseudonocardia oceani]